MGQKNPGHQNSDKGEAREALLKELNAVREKEAEILRRMSDVGLDDKLPRDDVAKFQEELRKKDEVLQVKNEELSVQTEELEAQLEELRCTNDELENSIEERKQVEELLKKNRNDLKLVLESTDEGIIQVDSNCVCMLVNASAASMLGYRPDEIIGKQLHDLTCHSHADSTACPIEQCSILTAIRTGNGKRVRDEVFYRKDGTAIPVEYSAYSILDKSAILGAVVSFFDITEWKKAEQKIAYLASFPEKNSNPIIEIGDTGAITYMNPAAEHLFPDLRSSGAGHQMIDGIGPGILKQDQINTIVRDVLVNGAYYQQNILYIPQSRTFRVYSVDITKRKTTEILMRKRADLIDLSPDGIMVRRLDGKITFWGKGAESLYGWTREAARGQLSHTLLKTLFPEPLEEINSQLIRTGYWSGELIHTTKYGRKISVQSRWRARYDASGALTEIMESNVDITERKMAEAGVQERQEELEVQAEELESQTEELRAKNAALETHILERKQVEEALRKNEETLRHIIDSSPVPMVLHDENENVIQVNKKFTETFGYTIQDIPSINEWWTLAYPDEKYREFVKKRWYAAIGHAINNNASIAPREVEVTCRDGSKRHILSEFSSIGNINLSVLYDITELKQAEYSLRMSEASLAKSQEMAHIGSWEMNVETGAIDRSAESYRILGFAPGEVDLSYSLFLECIVPEDRERVDDSIKLTIKTGQPYNILYTIKRRDGESRILLSHGEAIRDDSGRIITIFGTNQDITEQKHAEEERDISVDFLRLVNESRGIEDLIRSATAFFQVKSGCEAVGIRLKDGDDYPYYETRGFSKEFVLAETHLCLRDNSGLPVYENDGNPILECMCGNIIRGRFDPSKPFFTARGSFWTNSTTQLLATTTDADRQARTRNRCNGEGYESVTVIAIRHGDECLGTLQLNDRQIGRFTPESIAMWERLTDYLAVALAKFKAEQTQLETSNYLESLINYANAPIIVWDPDFKITRFNHAFERLTGYTSDEMVGKELDKLFPSDSKIKSLVRIKRTLTGEYMESVEVPILRKDGDTRIVLWNSANIYGKDGTMLVATIAQGQDITERMQAEAALRESEGRFRALADNIPNLAWMAGPDGWIFWYNKQWYDYTGTTLEEMQGWGWQKVHHPDYVKPVTELWNACIELGKPFDDIFPLRGKDGNYRWFLTRITPIKDEHGKIQRWFGTNTDITERKQAEEESKDAKMQAELYLDLMGHDISNMHQIALAQLEIAQEIMAEEGRLEGDEHELIDTPIETLGRSARLIDNVRKLQKLSTGEYQVETIDLGALLNDIVTEHSCIPGTDVTISYKAIDGCFVKANPLLKDVFNNLVGNAIKHSSGNEINIAINLEKAREKNRDHYKVSVEDNGPGIADDMKDKIFNRLQRGETKARGMGLGLYIARTLVESYGGYMKVEDRVPGDHTKGAKFLVYLPVEK